MLKANRQAWFVFLARLLIRLALRRRFRGVYLAGLDNLQGLDTKQSLVGCANHTNWWDGFVVGLLTEQTMRRRFYVAQEERQLRRYWFFRFAGAFGVDLDTQKQRVMAVRHAQSLLRKPGALVWIFPQGKLAAPDCPIQVRRGATFIAAQVAVTILPCALRYEFRDQENPAVIIVFGRPLPAPATPEALQAELRRLAEEAKRYADPDVPLPEGSLLPTKHSLNERWDAGVAWVKRLIRR